MRADIFCKAVDNYGDIGVCWRLARRLAHGMAWQVRLWLDDLPAFARIRPGIDPTAARQTVAGIDIVAWRADTPALVPGDVVIEAFACDPPPAFRAAMRERSPIWLNLEYLSAEDWVESCHGLPSPQPDGLVKYFFFPGFTARTGHLLREPGLSAERDAFQLARGAQRDFLTQLGLHGADLAAWDNGARVATLFCYPDAPVHGLTQALESTATPTLLLVPETVAPGLATGTAASLRIARVPFLPQEDYDRLLWCADLNFVRGEDSFVRAAWAARPLAWQIYRQEENAHLVKLEAWLARYPAPQRAREAIRAWNASPDTGAVARALSAAIDGEDWANWRQAAVEWDRLQSAGPDLAEALAAFCAGIANKG
jgi:uncharacterized repeat protein (TIGR03837 family)